MGVWGRTVAVTVYLKNGGSARVSNAVSMERGSFLLSEPSATDSAANASLELQDDKKNVVGKFLWSEVAGYVIESQMSLEDIASAARSAASSAVGAARRRSSSGES